MPNVVVLKTQIAGLANARARVASDLRSTGPLEPGLAPALGVHLLARKDRAFAPGGVTAFEQLAVLAHLSVGRGLVGVGECLCRRIVRVELGKIAGNGGATNHQPTRGNEHGCASHLCEKAPPGGGLGFAIHDGLLFCLPETLTGRHEGPRLTKGEPALHARCARLTHPQNICSLLRSVARVWVSR